MSLIAAYTFNESACHDYSGNKYHLTNTGGVSYSATTCTNNGFGIDAVFAISTYLNTASWYSMGSLAGFSCFFNFSPSAHDHNIAASSGAFQIYFNGSNKITFSITDSTSATHTVTSSTALTLNTWYTVGCVWDGTALYIYINATLDNSTSVSFTNIHAGSGLMIGAGAMHINNIDFHNRALALADIMTLDASPGGTLFNSQMHSFVVGDLIADNSVQTQAVVTWVVDAENFYAYPFTNPANVDYVRVGNIYNTARQNFMELATDFDGNGSGQIRIKYPIASFVDYASPLSTITLDHNGLSGSASNVANMMAITSLRI